MFLLVWKDLSLQLVVNDYLFQDRAEEIAMTRPLTEKQWKVMGRALSGGQDLNAAFADFLLHIRHDAYAEGFCTAEKKLREELETQEALQTSVSPAFFHRDQ